MSVMLERNLHDECGVIRDCKGIHTYFTGLVTSAATGIAEIAFNLHEAGRCCGVPELPEVEVLVRHLDRLLRGRMIRTVTVRRDRVIRPTTSLTLKRKLTGAEFVGVKRRAKFMVFDLLSRDAKPMVVLGHLGMSGRMYLQPKELPLAKHAAVVLDLGDKNFVFEDTRYFGRFTLDLGQLEGLGPEPLSDNFCAPEFGKALKRSKQAIKVKLLDQRMVAGLGNIYASEALFRAGIAPRKPAHKLTTKEAANLCRAIRQVLGDAIKFGSTVPLDFPGNEKSNGLFYYGVDASGAASYEERLLVYDREDQPCFRCRQPIRRIVQAARSTFFCPKCQGGL